MVGGIVGGRKQRACKELIKVLRLLDYDYAVAAKRQKETIDTPLLIVESLWCSFIATTSCGRKAILTAAKDSCDILVPPLIIKLRLGKILDGCQRQL